MSIAFERLIQYFEERDLAHELDAEREILRAKFAGEVGTRQIVAVVDAEDDLFQVFSRVDLRVPEGARPAVAEALSRANYGFKVGKFELDFSDGEVRFQASSILTAGILEDQVIVRLIGHALAMLDRYLPAVLSVIYANEAPADAIRCVEADLVSSRAD